MEFHAYHGCLEHEQTLGNTFLVTLSMELDTEIAQESDNLEDTLNYQLVYDAVKSEMEIPSKLIEHLAQRIVNGLFHKFTQIKSLRIKLSKKNPPLGGKVAFVSIEMDKNRL
jgi:dihydroneopterin aldolase